MDLHQARPLMATLFLHVSLALATAVVLSAADCAVLVSYQSTQAASPPPDFAGISLEKILVLSTFGEDFISGSNEPLVALFQALGVKSLRIGGGTGDWVTCTLGNRPGPIQGYPCLASYTPSSSDLQRMASFIRATGARSVLYMLSVLNSPPEEPAAEASLVSSSLINSGSSASLYWELGNEPNTGGLPLSSYIWRSRPFIQSIRAFSRGAAFSGPDAVFATNWPAQAAKSLKLSYSTFHHYPGGPSTGRRACKLDYLLHITRERYTSWVNSWANKRGIRRRISELSSCYDHGAPGVSDTFGAALWLLDYMHFMASHGIGGVNLHWHASTKRVGYNPVVPTGSAPAYNATAPIHGMKAFTLLSPLGGRYFNLNMQTVPDLPNFYIIPTPSAASSSPQPSLTPLSKTAPRREALAPSPYPQPSPTNHIPLHPPPPSTYPPPPPSTYPPPPPTTGGGGRATGPMPITSPHLPPPQDVRVYAFSLEGGHEVGLVVINRNLTSAWQVVVDKTAFPVGPLRNAQGLWFVADSVAATTSEHFGFARPGKKYGRPLVSTRANLNFGVIPSFSDFPDPDSSKLDLTVPPISALFLKWAV